MAPGTEFAHYFCAGIGPLQLGVVLVSNYNQIILYQMVSFVPYSRGFLLGLWSSCASVGNVIGAVLVSSVLSYGYEVR